MITNNILTDSDGRTFDLSTVYYRTDGSFVITLRHDALGDLPFHVPNTGEFAGLHAEVTAWRADNEEHFVAEPEEQVSPLTEEELAEQAAAKALSQASVVIMAHVLANTAQTDSFTTSEFALFAKARLFTDWAAGQTYAKGYRLAHKGVVYEVMQDVTSIESQPPDASGMLAVYRPLSVDPETGEEPDGSKEHPYAFLYGMDVYSGKYYSYNSHLYLAKSDMMACVWPPDTEGLWQWELVE